MAEPVRSSEPVPFAEAVELLRALRCGTAGDDEIPDPPILVVRLDRASASRGQTAEALRPPAHLPCVVAAVAGSGDPSSGASPPAGADLYITGAPAPPRPWVCADVDGLVSAVRRNPQASTVLAQVLRVHTGEVERDLITESLAYATLQAGAEHRCWLEENPGRRSGDDDAPDVRVTRSDGELDIALDRPARRNAFSARMRDELVEALRLASIDTTITSVHLEGNGAAFCSGGDLAEFGTVDNASTAHRIRMTRSAGYHAHLLSDRLSVRVHGTCVGAGVEIPAFAARVSAAPDSTFRLPEVGMGLIPGAGGTASIPRRIGRTRTAWLALTGTELDAGTALQWGLVDSVDPA
jgi:hypothetical protein